MIIENEEIDQVMEKKNTKMIVKTNKQIPFYIKFLMVLSFYSIQGMATDFFVYSVQTELVMFGANNKQLALLSLISFPWCMKILWAPLQDAYYFKFLGRRKSWIIMSCFLLAILWFYFSFQADNLFKQLSVGELTMIGIVTTFLLAVQDISMDGWIIKLAVNDAQLARFSFCSSFGWTVGGLVSFQIYMWLQSDEWCQYLFYRDHILTTNMLVNFIAFSFIVMGFVVLLVPESKDSVELEDEEQEKQESTRLKEIFTKLKLLRQKPHLKTLILVVFFCELGFQYFDSVGPVLMLDMGMNPNIYALIGFISIVLEGIVGIIVSSYPDKEMTIFMMSLILRTLNSLFFLLIKIVHDLEFLTFQQTLILFGIQNNIAQIGYAMVSIPLLNFFLRICEEKVEGTYIALLTSAFFAAAIWSSTAVFLLVDYLGHNLTMITSLIYDVVFIMYFKDKILKWEKLQVEQWALKTT